MKHEIESVVKCMSLHPLTGTFDRYSKQRMEVIFNGDFKEWTKRAVNHCINTLWHFYIFLYNDTLPIIQTSIRD
jgi:prephenate dehydrogenase